MSLESNRILRWIVFLPIIGVLVTTVLFVSIYLKYENGIYQKEIENVKVKYLKDSKIKSQERIENISSLLKVNEKLLKKEARQEVENIVKLAIEIVTSTHINNSNLTKKEILQKIKDKLRNIRFFDNLSGYFFVYTLDGVCVLLPPRPSAEGKNFITLQDAKGKKTLQDMISIVENEGQGFDTWYWQKPGYMEGEMKKKIGFVQIYEPLNIFIGTATYEEDIMLSIKNEAKDFLNNVEYADGGKIFAYNNKGELVTENLDNSFLKKSKSQIKQIITGSQIQPEGFFISYATSISFNASEILQHNSSFVKYIPGLEWVVGINTYGKNIAKEIKEKEIELEKKVENSLLNMTMVVIAVIGVVLLLMLVVSKKLQRILDYYQARILIKHDRTIKQKKLLQHQVHHDSLTKLPNRILLAERLSQLIKRAKRERYNLAIVFIDVDKFKMINDTYGHHIGDSLLKKVAKKFESVVRDTDLVGRLSGDEFIVVFDKCRGTQDIMTALQGLQRSFEKPIRLRSNKHKITLSIGISVYPNDGKTVQELLKNADTAMLNAKDEGRNTYKFFTSQMNDNVEKQLRIEEELRKALRNEEFVLHYQPIVNAKTGSIEGTEALIRWQHPERGLVYPDYFIEIAEDSNLIIDIGEWVTREAMRQVVSWRYKGLNPGRVSINFAGKQLEKEGAYEFIMEALEDTHCKPEWIGIEVVERYIMKNPQKCIELLRKLRDINIGISIDDFGTGYSSLSYLKQLPITKLKVDRTFVQNVKQSFEDRAIAKTVIALAEGLYLKVLAEGVETKEQREFFVDNGCTQLQGYLFSKPVSAQEIEKLLTEE